MIFTRTWASGAVCLALGAAGLGCDAVVVAENAGGLSAEGR